MDACGPSWYSSTTKQRALTESTGNNLPVVRIYYIIVIYSKNKRSALRMKGVRQMKEKYIAEITELLARLNDNQLLFILTFIKKMFGGV